MILPKTFIYPNGYTLVKFLKNNMFNMRAKELTHKHSHLLYSEPESFITQDVLVFTSFNLNKITFEIILQRSYWDE